MRHFIRYSAVGGIATAVHFLLLIACVEFLGWAPWVASGMGAVVGAQLGYAGNRWFTFAHAGRFSMSWPRFQITALLGAVTGMAVVAALVAASLDYRLAQCVATALILWLTFAINRRWTFQ